MGQLKLEDFMSGDALNRPESMRTSKGQTGTSAPPPWKAPRRKTHTPSGDPLNVQLPGVEYDHNALASKLDKEIKEGEIDDALTRSGVRETAQQVATVVEEGQVIEHEPTKIPVGPLRIIAAQKPQSRAKLINLLVNEVPVNEFGLPGFAYRSDLLLPDLFAPLYDLPSLMPQQVREMQYQLEAASIELQYDEGFPTLPSGQPFWEQLPWETKESFDAFVAYLELSGARTIGSMVGYQLEQVGEWFHLNYWKIRVRAFELFRIANHQRVKLERILNLEDEDYKRLRKWDKLMDEYVELIDDHVFNPETVSPEKAVKMLGDLIKLKRMTLGLGIGEQKVETDRTRTPQSVEVTLRQAAEVAQLNKPRVQGEEELDILREDPEAIDMAQELIIRIQNGSREQE
jgi:hypothetical protein